MDTSAPMDHDRPGGAARKIRVGEEISLDDADRIWIVRSGTLALFARPAGPDSAGSGGRRLLFELRAGQAAPGASAVAPGCGLTLAAVAIDDAEVREVPLARIAGLPRDDRGAGLDAVDEWIARVATYMAGQPIRESAVVTSARRMLVPGMAREPIRVADARKSMELKPGQIVAPERGAGLWIRVRRGTALFLGIDGLPLRPDGAAVPLGPDAWVVMAAETELAVWPSSALPADGTLRDGLARLQALLADHLRLLATQQIREERERLARSAHLEAQRRESSLAELAAVLDPVETLPVAETPLVTAAAVVGQALGLRIRPPAASEDPRHVKDPVDAVARASRVRVRKVLLADRWWRKDCGPLLGRLGEDNARPVALLRRGSGYEVVDPVARTRKPLDREVLEALSPEAHVFYRPFPDEVRGVGRVFRFSLGGRARDLVFVAACGLAVTLLGMLVPEVTGRVIDRALPGADRGLLLDLAIVLAAAAVGSALFTLAQGFVAVRTGTLAEGVTQPAMWDRLLRLRVPFHRGFSSGDLQQRVSAVSEIGRELNGATIRPLFSGILALLNFALLWNYSPDLAHLAILAAAVILVATATAGARIRRRAAAANELASRVFGMVVQMIAGVGRIRVAGAEHRGFHHWVGMYSGQVRQVLAIQRLKDLVVTFNLALPVLATALVFWKASDLVSSGPGTPGALTMGAFLAFNTAFMLFLNGATDVSDTFVRVLDTLTRGKRVQPLLDARPEVDAHAADPGRLRGALRIEDVTFRYKPDGPPVLDGVSLHAAPGEFVAVVGPSGSGKSTILRTLLGFETPERGRVLFDGQDLSGLDVLAVRRQFGVVLQNGRLGAGSILDNIANNAALTPEEAVEAVVDAAFADDLREMPMGLHSMVSEGGTNLSGGQRQRLLIARALALGPRIVFFDEATSALDNRTQSIVSKALERRRVTRVVIAHRLSTIQNADRIYVLDRGRIVQEGAFAGLAAAPGLFRDLVARQTA